MTSVDSGDPSRARQVRPSRVRRPLRAYDAEPRSGRAPGRVNLIGEHTDYNDGLVLPVALPHATYAAAAARDDGVLSDRERPAATTPWEGRLADRARAASTVGRLRRGRGVGAAEDGPPCRGSTCCVDSTVPLGAGLSSSAALECSVAVARRAGALGLAARRRSGAGWWPPACGPRPRSSGAPTGGMDQTVAMLARGRRARCSSTSTPTHRSASPALADAGLTLLVTDTRVSHALVDGGYGAPARRLRGGRGRPGRPVSAGRDADGLGAVADDRLRRRARHVVTEIVRVARGGRRARRGRLGRGRARSSSPRTSRCATTSRSPARSSTSPSTPPSQAGAVGARMTGGGFGGSSVAVVPDDRVDAVSRAVDTAFVLEGFAAPAPPPRRALRPGPRSVQSSLTGHWLFTHRMPSRREGRSCPERRRTASLAITQRQSGTTDPRKHVAWDAASGTQAQVAVVRRSERSPCGARRANRPGRPVAAAIQDRAGDDRHARATSSSTAVAAAGRDQGRTEDPMTPVERRPPSPTTGTRAKELACVRQRPESPRSADDGPAADQVVSWTARAHDPGADQARRRRSATI